MEIDKALYSEIKEYCELNHLKTREYIYNLLKKAFMEDKYGKMPSILNKRKEINKADEEFAEIVKNVGGIEKFNDLVDECIMSSNTITIPSIEEKKPKVIKTIKRQLNE